MNRPPKLGEDKPLYLSPLLPLPANNRQGSPTMDGLRVKKTINWLMAAFGESARLLVAAGNGGAMIESLS